MGRIYHQPRRLFVLLVSGALVLLTLYTLTHHETPVYVTDSSPVWEKPVPSRSPSPITVTDELAVVVDHVPEEDSIEGPAAKSSTTLSTTTSASMTKAAPPVSLQTSLSTAPSLHPEPLSDYKLLQNVDEYCEARYGLPYLEDFLSHTGPYCDPQSPSKIQCFFSWTHPDGNADALCIGQGAIFDEERGKFLLDCVIQSPPAAERKAKGLLGLRQLPEYWYKTGPQMVFQAGIIVENATAASAEAQTPVLAEQLDASPLRTPTPSSGVVVDTQHSGQHDLKDTVPPPKNFLLVKREGETNPWHSLLEIFSALMTFDVLQLARDPEHEGLPYYDMAMDPNDTQVVILDDRADGPYFDLWTVFAQRRPLRLKDLGKDQDAINAIKDANVIVPLAGARNPLWQADSLPEPCHSAPILDVFARRVLKFYGIPEPPAPKGTDPIMITFIDRRHHRRLYHQQSLFDKLIERNPRVKVQLVDFEEISFDEQVNVARNTDILVGVHGAGLTHTMFMRPGAGAVVEIQPDTLDHRVFQSVATLLGLDYFRIHSQSVAQGEWDKGHSPEADTSPEGGELQRSDSDTEAGGTGHGDGRVTPIGRRRRALEKTADWHWRDVEIDEERFLDVVEAAIKSMYTKGSWNYDIN